MKNYIQLFPQKTNKFILIKKCIAIIGDGQIKALSVNRDKWNNKLSKIINYHNSILRIWKKWQGWHVYVQFYVKIIVFLSVLFDILSTVQCRACHNVTYRSILLWLVSTITKRIHRTWLPVVKKTGKTV